MYEPKDDEDGRKKLNVFHVYNTNFAKDDVDYYKNLYSAKPKLRTIDECIDFYSMWFAIHRQVLKYWNSASD